MPHPSKRKGHRFEREIVSAFEEAGLEAERAWGSNGKHLTTTAGEACSSDVDVLVEGTLKVQCKRRKSVAQYLKPPAGGTPNDRACRQGWIAGHRAAPSPYAHAKQHLFINHQPPR